MTEGLFLDPSGNLMMLRSTSPDSFRVLVTRKLAAGWRYASESPAVAPKHDDTQLAIPPEPAPTFGARVAAFEAVEAETISFTADFSTDDEKPE